jgi:hypothetical protein
MQYGKALARWRSYFEGLGVVLSEGLELLRTLPIFNAAISIFYQKDAELYQYQIFGLEKGPPNFHTRRLSPPLKTATPKIWDW